MLRYNNMPGGLPQQDTYHVRYEWPQPHQNVDRYKQYDQFLPEALLLRYMEIYYQQPRVQPLAVCIEDKGSKLMDYVP